MKLESHDKQLIGTVAAKIRSLRKPEHIRVKVFVTRVRKFVVKLVRLLLNN